MENLKLDEIEKLPRDYLTAQEVAAVMGISCHTLYRQCKKFPFPVLRVGRNYRIPKQPFIRYMRTGRTADDR